MRTLIRVLKAAADEQRVRILWALRNRELCVCQIVELLGLAQSTVSKHLALLQHAGLIDSRKQGRWIYYRAEIRRMPPEARAVAATVFRILDGTPEAIEAGRRLQRILRIDPETLCRRQQASSSGSVDGLPPADISRHRRSIRTETQHRARS